jgi:pyruvate dehydrogenase E1 component alpha subunit
MNIGAFHEALNLAGLWKLPVIFVVENNQYAMGTSLRRSSAVLDLTVRGGTAYGMPGVCINGNDVELMAATTREAADRARSGEGPTFIEAQTYRFKGHSISDPGKYRIKDELAEAIKNDPILAYQNVLKERGWIDDEAIEGSETRSRRRWRRASPSPRRARRRPSTRSTKTSRWPPYIPQE